MFRAIRHALALASAFLPLRYWADTWHPDSGVPNPGARRNPDGGLPPWPYPLGPTVLFSDDFATDLSGWTDTDAAVAGGVAIMESPEYLNTTVAGGNPASGIVSLRATASAIAGFAGLAPSTSPRLLALYDAGFSTLAFLAYGKDELGVEVWTLGTEGTSTVLDAADFAAVKEGGATVELVAYPDLPTPKCEVYVGGVLVGSLEAAGVDRTFDNIYLSAYTSPATVGLVVTVGAVSVADDVQGV